MIWDDLVLIPEMSTMSVTHEILFTVKTKCGWSFECKILRRCLDREIRWFFQPRDAVVKSGSKTSHPNLLEKFWP